MNTIASFTTASCILLVLIVILVNHTDSKAVEIMESKPQHEHSIAKRNTWWSKKSMDFANRRILDTTANRSPDSSCQDLKDALACYTQECVNDFVWCMTERESDQQILQCDVQHKLCTNKCLAGREA